jgi:hypothetical protein
LRDDGNGLIFSCLICDKYLSPITVDGAKIFIEMLMESGQINFEKFSGLEKALEFFIRDKKDAYCHKTKQGNFCSKGCFDKFINSAQKLLDENLCDYDAYGLGIKEFFSNSKSYTNVKLTGHFDKN